MTDEMEEKVGAEGEIRGREERERKDIGSEREEDNVGRGPRGDCGEEGQIRGGRVGRSSILGTDFASRIMALTACSVSSEVL